MKDFMGIILKRRSIRKYQSKTIEKDKIKNLLKAAMYAPSAVNKQPWHFIVIDDKALMNKVIEVHPNSKMLREASHAVLICGDEQKQHDDGYWIADCGAATQNLLLAAEAEGLGACWIGIYPREKRMEALSAFFGLPSHVKPFALVSLGYPNETKEMPDRFDLNKVCYNQWSKPY